ncbi:MGMT family protein [Enterococcus gilvus]|uniref:MGMT family protein n=1 Tax=Enterococcus gilvus TaxID=160453 RepID=UPI00290A7BBC|nr:MGMT family protein [Enterococcus gilvus]MDU5512231.1 MGMT family protein [Enterococcus gilvus]
MNEDKKDFNAMLNEVDFTDSITAGVFISITAWTSEQHNTDQTPYRRTIKANGEINPKFSGGIEKQREMLEAEGYRVIHRGRKKFR